MVCLSFRKVNIFAPKKWKGHTLSMMEDGKPIKLESLVERIREEQTNEVTDVFMELVVALCNEPETDRTLKELVNR